MVFGGSKNSVASFDGVLGMTNEDEPNAAAQEAKPSTKLDISISSVGEAFVVAEYDALRREIEPQIAERRKAENQILIAIAAVYARVLTREQPLDPILFRVALALPAGLAIGSADPDEEITTLAGPRRPLGTTGLSR